MRKMNNRKTMKKQHRKGGQYHRDIQKIAKQNDYEYLNDLIDKDEKFKDHVIHEMGQIHLKDIEQTIISKIKDLKEYKEKCISGCKIKKDKYFCDYLEKMIDEGKQAALYDGASNMDVSECTKYLNIVKEIRIYIEHFNIVNNKLQKHLDEYKSILSGKKGFRNPVFGSRFDL